MCECLLYTNDNISASPTIFFNTYSSYVLSFRLALIVYTFTKYVNVTALCMV